MNPDLVPNPYAITMDRNFGATGGRRTLSAEPRAPHISRAVWNHLHKYLAAEASAISRVVLLSATPSEVPDLGWQRAGDPLRGAMSRNPDFRSQDCISVNLGDPVALCQLEEDLLTGTEPHLFVVGNVVEQLADPRPLLRMLRRLLKHHSDSRLVIATLDANLEADPSSVRLWSKGEFASFLVSAGFVLLFCAQVMTDQAPIVISEVRCSTEYYEAFLSKSYLPVSSTRLILISADYDHLHTSNIERYVIELERSQSPLIVMSFNRKASQSPTRQWLRAEDFAPKENAWVVPDSILEALLHVIFIYDEIIFVEYQDYGGIFFRVSQAKRSGLLPPSLFCRVVCHGNRFYVERITRKFQPPSENL